MGESPGPVDRPGSGGEPAGPHGTGGARRGWYFYGWASHVFPTLVTAVFMSRYLTSVAEDAVGTRGRVHVAGVPIAPGSLFVYTVSASTVLLVLLMPVVGALADRTRRKRDIMLGCGLVGALACVAMVAVGPGDWQLGAVLYAVAYIFYSLAIVVHYSLLVDLSGVGERDALSSKGWAVSYLGGGLLLAVSFAVSLFVDKATLARLALCASGLWWIAFSVPVRRLLPERIGAGATAPERGTRLLSAGFRQLRDTVRHVRRFPLTLAFLGAFLIYNDGIQTVATVAAQYGDKQLHLSDTVLLLAILVVQFTAFGGALLLGAMAGRWGAKRVILGSLVVWLIAIGLAYELQAGVAWQFFAVAVLIAIVLGGAQALSRSLFSRMIPAGMEAPVLQLLRDQRRRHQLARPARLRTGVPGLGQLPLGPGLARRCSSWSDSSPWPWCRSGGPWPRPATSRPSWSEGAGPLTSACPRLAGRGREQHRRPRGTRLGTGLRQPARAADGGQAQVLLRADGLRQVDAGPADRPQPRPSGATRAAADPLRPVRRAHDHHAGRAQPRRRRGRGRPGPASRWSATSTRPGAGWTTSSWTRPAS